MGYDGEYDWVSAQYEQAQRRDEARMLARETTPEEDAKALFEAQEMYSQVHEMARQGTYLNVCLAGEPVFFMAYSKALIPGHIYSKAGRDEFYISRSCEYHFDEWCAEPDDEDEPVDEFYYNEPDALKPF